MRAVLIVVAVGVLLELNAAAATFTKADTTTMNLTTDWTNGLVPGASDVGLFDLNLSAAKAANLTLGANLNFGGLLFANSLNGPVTIGTGNTLTLNGSGLDLSFANQNVALNCAVTVGASQMWLVGSNNLIIGGTIAGASGRTLTLGGTVVSAATISNVLNSSGMTVKFNGGAWTLIGDGAYGANLELDSGTVLFPNRNCYLNSSGQTLTIHGGTWLNQNFYGLRLGSTFGANSGGGNFTGIQDGGLLRLSGSSTLELGNNSDGVTVSYTLSGGTFSTVNNNFNLGSGTSSSTTTFTLTNTGKLFINGTLAGAQGAGAKQILALNGGTFVVKTVNATELSGAAAPASQGTLYNTGAAVAPGDIGIAGAINITGNFTQTNSGTLAIDIGGTTQATGFENGANGYDVLVVSGTATLGGALAVTITTNFIPLFGESYYILGCSNLVGTFTNVAFGGRLTTTGGEGSFLVTTNGQNVILSQFTPAVWPAAPVVSITPGNVTAAEGGATAFTAYVTSATAVRYQWRFNGTPIAGGTGPVLSVYNQPQNAGTYDVVVSNPGGATVASSVTLAVTPVWSNPVALIYRLDQTPVLGAGAITDATAQTAGTMIGSTLPAIVSGATALTGNAWDFSAASSYLSLTSNPTIQSLGDYHQTLGLSFSFWLKIPASVNNARVCGLSGVFDLYLNGGRLTFMGGGDLLFNPLFSYTTTSLADDTWHHVVFTMDFRNNSGVCYVDGAPQGNVAINTTLVTSLSPNRTASLNIGADASGNNQWKEALDEFAIYTKSLSATEVTQLYQNTGINVNAGTTNYSALLNPAPTVSVGANRILLWTNGAASAATMVTAVASDLGGSVTYAWSTQATPSGATATFGSTSASNTTVTFSSIGTYVLRCTVTDGAGLTDYDQISLIVASNQPPSISVCQASQSVLLNTNASTVNLTAVVLDDGLPLPPGIVSPRWTQVSGPASVSFLTPWTANTPVTIPATMGSYVLRLTVSDGALSATNNLTISVVTNLAPVVAAAAQTQILYWPTNTTTLTGTATDDGNPPGSALSYQWNQVTGPASAVIASSNTLSTTVAFPAVGMYIFQLAVSDTILTNTAMTYVDVWSPGAPQVNAGSCRVAWLPNAVVGLQGSYTAVTGAVSVAWSCAQGPGNVAFSAPNALATAATFTNAGKYRLGLTVTNTTGYLGVDYLVVEVYAAGTNYGYTTPTLNTYTNDLGLTYNYVDLAWAKIKPPPPACVHPRILFNPEDLPDIRSRLTNTIAGPIVMNKIRANAALITTLGASWRGAYDNLAADDPTAFNGLYNNWANFVNSLRDECFRCLIDNDTAGGAKAGAALATLTASMCQTLPGNLAVAARGVAGNIDWRPLQDSGVVYRDCIGWSYDFAYNFMTPAQQATVRQTLELMTTNMWNLGLDALPGFNGNDSNWIPLTGQTLLVNALAIENEAGADINVPLRYEALLDRMCSAFVFPDGAIYEGMGKGWIGEQTFWELARRGGMALATPNVRNHIRQFYLHTMETTGYGWTWDEMLGGNNQSAKLDDVVIAKYLFPTDPIVDFIYRNAFGSNYTNGVQTVSDGDPMYHTLIQAVGASDYNTSLTWNQALTQQILSNAPLSSLFDQRGLMVTRSDWTTNGLRMMFQPRSEPGGHSEADRNMFNLDALGRIYVPQCNGWADVTDFSDISSVPRIDGVGPSTVPGAVVDFGDTFNYAYGVGDASDCYSEQFGGSTTVASYTYNQKLIYPINEGWADLPWGVLPDWYASQSTLAYWETNTPVQRAFRTAGLVRGTTPYVLITDDLQKDNASHVYDWRMILPTDLAANYTQISSNDIVFTSTNPAGNLLVRVLSTSGAAGFAVASHSGQAALSVLVTNVAPDYKLLILPYTNAAVPVTTSWSNDVLTVQMADGQEDLVYFTKYSDGRTRVNPYRVAGLGVVLAAPTGLIATGGVAQASLRWNATPGALGYNVRNSLTSGGPYTLVATNVAATNYVQTNLVSGNTYYYVVTALNVYGESMNSAEAGAVPTGAPPVPTSLGANPDNTVIHLAWNPAAGATGYNVKRSLTSGTNYLVVATNWPSPSYDDSGLVNGTTYYYVVSSVNALGQSANSTEVSAVPNVHLAASLIWQGNALANSWDKENPADEDWLNGTVNVTFWDGDSVTFNDSGYWSTPVNLVTNLSPGFVEVNTGNNYIFSGSGRISGNSGLQKDGTGMLTLLNFNNYTGTNTINQGAVQVGNGGATGQLGHGEIIMGANTTLTFNTTTSQTNGSLNGAAATANNNNAVGVITFYQSPGAHIFGTIGGVSGATVVLDGDPASSTVVVNKFSTGGLNLKFGSGTWYPTGNGTVFAGNLEVDGGLVALTNRNGGQNCYMNQNGQVLTLHGGTLISSNQYGFRLGSTFDANSSGVNFTGFQDGGTFSYVGGEGFQLGNNTTNIICNYTLAGNGVLTQVGNTFNLGSGTNGSTTTFTLTNSAKLWVNGTIAGSQGAGAQQVFAFNGGTLVAGTVNAANLRGSANGPTNLLVNNGGTLAPGDLGVPGKTVITGNYAVSNSAASLAIDIGGTTQANAFTNAMNNYDFVSISGTGALGGSLNLRLVNNFVPATNQSFTIVAANGGLSGGFANLVNGRVPVANSSGGSVLVVTTPTSVVVTNFQVLLASFTASLTNGASPLSVTFTNTSSGNITNRSWNFGDGSTTNTAATNVTHTFTSAGTYLVTLTVSGNAGANTASLSVVVSAPSQPPVLGGISVSGTNLILTGTNGAAGANYYVLQTTNLLLPATNWNVVATNQFGPGGAVNLTNPLNPDSPPTFYRLRLP